MKTLFDIPALQPSGSQTWPPQKSSAFEGKSRLAGPHEDRKGVGHYFTRAVGKPSVQSVPASVCKASDRRLVRPTLRGALPGTGNGDQPRHTTCEGRPL